MAKLQKTPNSDSSNVMPLRAGNELSASDRAPIGECDDATLRQIGKKGAVSYKEGTTTIEHPTWMNAIGTEYVNLSEFIAEQMILLSAPGNSVSSKELSFLTEAVQGIAPKDHVEMMLATQMAAVHMLSMTMARNTRKATSMEQVGLYAKQANQFMRTFAVQAEALKRYRTGGKQVVKVKHVHVHEGGQAIVGNVTKGGGGE